MKFSASISHIELLIAKSQYYIDNPLTFCGQFRPSSDELANRIKGMTMVLKVIQEDPNPGSGDHNARLSGLVYATINSLKLKTDKSELCGVLVGMSEAVSAYNVLRRELSKLQGA